MKQLDLPSSPLSSAPAVGTVYIVTPGGTRALGGIGRMVSYIHRTWNDPDAPLTIVDSYGPGSKIKMPFYFAAAFLRLLFAALCGRIGMLHIHMSERLSVLRKGLVVHLGKAFGIPVVLHLHGADFADYCRSLPAHRLHRLRKMMQKVDAVVTLGEYWRDFVHDFLQVDASRIAVLHNAVPGPASIPERTGTGTCRILFLGVVCERKGVPTLLSALAHPALRALDWRVTMAGNGEVDFYRAEAERLGLSDRISFLGWVGETQARQLLAESDVLVLPSRNEGLPMAILEAMAYGLPVVATPVGSITDAIADGDTGLLVPVGDQEALARAILKLVENPSLRLHIGARAREQYLSMFDIAAFNRKLEHIFRQAKRQLPVS